MCVCVCVSMCVGGVFVRVQQSVNYFSDLILYLFRQTKVQMWVSLLALPNSIRRLNLHFMNPVVEAHKFMEAH